ncbi:glycosyltransferase family 87 protein [Hoeflea sp. TYP-13]|uniref:glycosyltransferase family 87 protein n=1 Tax=Hoeflea sp. TYP-13 TaxID=3230023 RepID=UPI0034C61612
MPLYQNDIPLVRPRLSRIDKLGVGVILAGSALFYISFYIDFLSSMSGVFDWTNHPIGRDFVNMWSGAKVAMQGDVLDLFDVEKFHAWQESFLGQAFPLHNWSYPPHLLPMIAVLAKLPYVIAYIAFMTVTFLLYAFAARLSGQAGVVAPNWLMMLALLLAPSTFVTVVAGQNGFLTGALFLAGMLLIERRPWLAGILFGILTVKPQLGVMVPIVLIALSAWRPIVSASVTTLVLVGLSMVLFGIHPWESYLIKTFTLQGDILTRGDGIYTIMMPTVFMSGRELGLPNAISWFAQAVSSLAAVVLTVWALRRPAEPALRLMIICLAVFLVTPYAFNYDMTFLSAALIYYVATRDMSAALPFERLLIGVVWIAPYMILPWGNLGFPVVPLFLWAMMGLCCYRIAKPVEPIASSARTAAAMTS